MNKFITSTTLWLALCASALTAQTVAPYLTKGDKSQLLQPQSTVEFSSTSTSAAATITLTPSSTYQTMDGFGLCLTEGSAEVIASLNSTQRLALLNELINPTSGIGISVIRISIGASDLSSSSYSYNETSGDVNMTNFSLAGPDLTYLIPVLKDMLAINPNIKILATPWTAPRWMKTNGAWVGGSLQTQYYEAYANYFVKYFQAMQSNGINIWAITPQNEPENPNNEPSMTMNSAEQRNFINQSLGPKMVSAGFANIKIIAFDHNCNNTAYPIDVLNNSTYVDGAAFHLYLGDISALSTVKNATNKNVYFTEQYTGSGGSFSGDFGWHMQNVVLGSINNWAKAVIEWNIATDTSYGPRTPGGCTTCLGAYTISNSTTYTKNVSYYIIGQISKVVKDGAIRVGTSSSNSSIICSAFQNEDGTMALVAYNSSGSSISVKVVNGSNSFVYTIPASSAVSFSWQESAPCNVAKPTNISAIALSAQSIQINWTDNATNESSYIIKRAASQGGATLFETTLPASTNSFTDTNLTSLTKYYYTVTAVGSCSSSTTTEATTLCGNIQEPYTNTPSAVPGIIQAEQFDKNGCPNTSAFYDKSTGNNRTYFRTSEDVDIEQISTNQYAIGWIEVGEWVEYTVDVATTGIYSLKLTTASAYSNTIGTVDLKTGSTLLTSVPINATEGWSSYQTAYSPNQFNLSKGKQILRLYFNALEFNFDSFELVLENATSLRSLPSDLMLSIFPNPAKDILNIVSNEELTNLIITDVSGRTVYATQNTVNSKTTPFEVDTDSFLNGFYFVTVQSFNSKKTEKIFVMK